MWGGAPPPLGRQTRGHGTTGRHWEGREGGGRGEGWREGGREGLEGGRGEGGGGSLLCVCPHPVNSGNEGLLLV